MQKLIIYNTYRNLILIVLITLFSVNIAVVEWEKIDQLLLPKLNK